MTKDKMSIIKDVKTDLDKFLGIAPAEAQGATHTENKGVAPIEDEDVKKPWIFNVKFNQEEKKVIKQSYDNSTYKSMHEFLKDAILQNQDFIKRK
jgi:hypothetical protein